MKPYFRCLIYLPNEDGTGIEAMAETANRKLGFWCVVFPDGKKKTVWVNDMPNHWRDRILALRKGLPRVGSVMLQIANLISVSRKAKRKTRKRNKQRMI